MFQAYFGHLTRLGALPLFIYKLYIKSGNAATVVWYCALSVLARYKHCSSSSNNALVRKVSVVLVCSGLFKQHRSYISYRVFFYIFSSIFRLYFFFFIYIKSDNVATVLRHYALSVFAALCKHCNGNSTLVRIFFSFEQQ